MSLVIRSNLAPATLAQEVRTLIGEQDPGVPLYEVALLSSEVESASAVAARRVPLILLGAFAAAALLVAVVGLYGVVSFNVVKRRREFGIRQALGAGPGEIRRMVLRQGAILAGVGIAVGGLLSLGLGRALRSLLFGVGPGDPVALLGAGGLLALVTLVASYLPARHATRIDPTEALRSE
jgi:ABC-type antimicrobial peptide transport system permease subunit